MAIDIGAGAVNRAGGASAATRVAAANPANATGVLDTWQLWFAIDASDVEVATFYVVSGNNLSTRDSETIGAVSSGSLQTFTGLDTGVETGDYAGVYFSAGSLERDTSSGSGNWYQYYDLIPCTNAAFSWSSTLDISVYATGTESGPTARTSAETGAGVDSRLSVSAGLVRADTGGGSDDARNRSLASRDVGLGADAAVIPGLKSVLGSDGGAGDDDLKALIGTSGSGADMKLPGRQGHVRIPSKGVSL